MLPVKMPLQCARLYNAQNEELNKIKSISKSFSSEDKEGQRRSVAGVTTVRGRRVKTPKVGTSSTLTLVKPAALGILAVRWSRPFVLAVR